MGSSRFIREIEADGKRLLTSIYYPIEETKSSSYLSLYEQDMLLAGEQLNQIGLKEDFLKQLKVSFENNRPICNTEQRPIVIFSPGIGIDRDMYTYLIEWFNSKLFIVITIGHVFDTLFTIMPNHDLLLQEEAIKELDYSDFKALQTVMKHRKEDIVLVLEAVKKWQTMDSDLTGLFDLQKVIGVGHSIGGAAMITLAQETDIFNSIISLDGSLHLIDSSKDLAVPLLQLRQQSSSLEEMKLDWQELVATAFASNQARLAKQKQVLSMKVKQANHLAFSDIPLLFQTNKNGKQVHQSILEAVKLFINAETGHSEHIATIDVEGLEK